MYTLWTLCRALVLFSLTRIPKKLYIYHRYSLANLHRLISAAIGRRVTSDPAELPFLPGGKSCALAPLNIIPKFPKEKHKFLSDLSSKFSTFMCSICMFAKGYSVSLKTLSIKKWRMWRIASLRWTVAETFAWRLLFSLTRIPEKLYVYHRFL